MKTTLLTLLTALGLCGLSALAQPTGFPPWENGNVAAPPDQGGHPPEQGNPTPEATPPDQTVVNGPETAPAPITEAAPAEKKPIESTVILPTKSDGEAVTSAFIPPAQPIGTNTDGLLRMNFRNAPLEMVLNYLSDAAGFIIVLDTRVNGNVSVISSHPMTRNEAVDLLNSVLNKNGYAAIRNGRTLTIVDKNDAKTRDIPVKTGNLPDQIPNNAEIVTQIIPIRFVEARQLVSDLTSFVSPQATVVANEAGNSIVITDTQSNIRHLAEIIKAVDDSAEAETEIRVFHLKHASPSDVASELASIFPSSGTSGNNTQSPIRFGGGGGGPGGFFARMMGGGGGGNASGGSNDRIKKATQVNAVADSRIQAVIVTAPKELMEQIGSMMNDLDVPSTRDQKVFVFHMNNGDPQQAAQVLQTMFQSSSSRSSSSSSSQNSALMQRAQNNASTTSSSSSSSSSGFGTSGSGGRGGAGGLQF